jgi:hypothetical protein
MPKYKTRDQHVVRSGDYIPPYTEVEVPEKDVEIWEELVRLKAADRVETFVEAADSLIEEKPKRRRKKTDGSE